jgi:hypothetical protein
LVEYSSKSLRGRTFAVNANYFDISTPQHRAHYSPIGNSYVLDIVVHQNIRLSLVRVSDILDSDHLPIVFHILDLVTTNKLLESHEKFMLGAVSGPSL